MVINTLSYYPVGQAFDPNMRLRYKALPLPESTLSLVKLEEKPLDNDKNLKRLAEELHNFYLKEKMSLFKPQLRMEVPIDVLFTEVLRELLIALFKFEGRDVPQSPNRYQPQSEYDAVYGLLFALIHSSCMQEWIKEQLSGEQKLNEGVMKRLRNLKETLIKYTTALDEVLQRYTFEHGSGPMTAEMLKKVKESKDGIKDIIKRIKPNELEKLMPNPKIITQDHILCSVLGIDAECAEWLAEMPEEIRGHQTDQQWVERYIDQKANELELEESVEGAAAAAQEQSTQAQFVALGFTQHRAKYLTEWLQEHASKEYGDHQTLFYWAKLYIEDAFKYDILLTNVPRYPYNPDEKKKWMEKTFSTEDRLWDDEEDEDEEEDDVAKVPPQLPVSIINLNGLKDNSYTTLNSAQFPPESDDEKLVLFHGTDHKSAKSLIEEGIKFLEGRNPQDFSGVSREGFYLSPDLGWTKYWTGCQSASHSAVVVYCVPRKLLDEFQKDKIELYDDREKWVEIIRHCRTDGAAKLSKLTKKEYKNASFIEGPMCTTSPKNVGPHFSPEGFQRGIKQTCILSEKMGSIVGDLRHIHGVLFF